MESPHVIAITELRRRTSDVLEGPVAHGIPVFITQRGYVTAVILSRAAFDRLARSTQRVAESTSSAERDGGETAPPAGIESFGPLPRGTLFETPWALVHAETADFFMQQGIPVRPYRREWTETGPLECGEWSSGRGTEKDEATPDAAARADSEAGA
jgi:prevent-host-death family protein